MKSADLPKEKASEPKEEARQPSVSIIVMCGSYTKLGQWIDIVIRYLPCF